MLTNKILKSLPSKLLKGLVLDLPFNESGGTIAVDSTGMNYCKASGAGFKFKNNSATFATAGSDSIDCGNRTSLNFTTAFTCSCWIKQSGNLGGIAKVTSGSSGFSYKVVYNVDDKIYVQLSGNGTTVTYSQSQNAYPTDQWVHLVAVFNGSGGSNSEINKQYFNGVLQTCNYVGTAPTTLYQSPTNMYINKFDASTYGNGILRGLEFYNRPFTPTEIRELYVKEKNIYGI